MRLSEKARPSIWVVVYTRGSSKSVSFHVEPTGLFTSKVEAHLCTDDRSSNNVNKNLSTQTTGKPLCLHFIKGPSRSFILSAEDSEKDWT